MPAMTKCRRALGQRWQAFKRLEPLALALDAMAARGLAFKERAFTVAEAKAAREAFITAASQIVQPVVRIDGSMIGDGRPGPFALALRREFHRHAEFT